LYLAISESRKRSNYMALSKRYMYLEFYMLWHSLQPYWTHTSIVHAPIPSHPYIHLSAYTYICNNTYLYVYTYVWIHMYSDTASLNYVDFLSARFQNIILLTSQYIYAKSCAQDQKLQDLILRTGLCNTIVLLNPIGWFIATWPKWSSGNVLYQLGTSSHRSHRRGWPLYTVHDS